MLPITVESKYQIAVLHPPVLATVLKAETGYFLLSKWRC